MRLRILTVTGVVALMAIMAAAISADSHVLAPGEYELQSGDYILATDCDYTVNAATENPLHLDLTVDCPDPTPTASDDPTATPTDEPEPTATETDPTATPEPSGHDTTVWHGPDGHTHEHGAPPPVWLPTSGPCANIAFEQMAIGREGHPFYKGYEGTTLNGVRIYIVNHIAPTIPGRSHGDHDETIIFLDLSGNYSCWQDIGHYSPTSDPTDPIDIFVKECGGGGPQGPIILVDCGLSSESWYQAPGVNWCDNTTHVNGVWEDINGNNRGDGGSRHMEISCYAPRLPGPGAVQVAPTLAQDCVVQFNICQFKATTSFAFDYTPSGVEGPN